MEPLRLGTEHGYTSMDILYLNDLLINTFNILHFPPHSFFLILFFETVIKLDVNGLIIY